MRLYLSSFHLGKQPELFTEMLGSNHTVALILNAGDSYGEDIRKNRLREQTGELAAIEVTAIDLDLRKYFGSPQALKTKLASCGGVWVPGGNTFVLRRAMRDSGFDIIITDLLAHDSIAYGGYSAGICVLAPNLKGIALVDEPQAVESTFRKPIIWEGLGILPYMPLPHYKSNHPESKMVDDQIKFCEQYNLPFKTLSDGEAIYVNGEVQKLIKAL